MNTNIRGVGDITKVKHWFRYWSNKAFCLGDEIWHTDFAAEEIMGCQVRRKLRFPGRRRGVAGEVGCPALEASCPEHRLSHTAKKNQNIEHKYQKEKCSSGTWRAAAFQRSAKQNAYVQLNWMDESKDSKISCFLQIKLLSNAVSATITGWKTLLRHNGTEMCFKST